MPCQQTNSPASLPELRIMKSKEAVSGNLEPQEQVMVAIADRAIRRMLLVLHMVILDSLGIKVHVEENQFSLLILSQKVEGG